MTPAAIRARDRLHRLACAHAHNAEEYEERAGTAKREARRLRAEIRELERGYWRAFGVPMPHPARPERTKLGKLARTT